MRGLFSILCPNIVIRRQTSKDKTDAAPSASFVGRGTRMGVEIGLAQFVEGGVGIDLRSGDAFVAEEVFDGFKVGTVVEHSRGKGVTEHVGRALVGGRYQAEVVFDRLADLGRREPPALAVDKKRSVVDAAHVAPLAEIGLQMGIEFGAKGDDAVFVTLAQHLDLTAGPTETVHVEPDEFGEAHAGGVEGEEDEMVAQAGEIVGKGRMVEQAVHLVFANESRQRSWQFGIGHEAHGVGLDEALPEEVFEKRAQRTEHPLDGLGLDATRPLSGHPAADEVAVDGGEILAFVHPTQPTPEGFEVRTVGAQGGGRIAAIHAEIVNKVGNDVHGQGG